MSTLYNIAVHAHSGLRWLLLLLLIYAVVLSFSRWRNRSSYIASDKKWYLITLILSHLQLVLGLYLYFVSPKVVFNENTMGDSFLRFYAVEHTSVMILAIVLITIAYRVFKSASETLNPYKKLFWYYFIALVLILSRIPWPGMDMKAGWF